MAASPKENKTRPTRDDVAGFLASVADPDRRADAEAVCDLMAATTGERPVMWGPSMVGFGRQPYRTSDGKEHEWFAVGFSPRKAALTLYGLTFYGSNADLLERLGRHTIGKGCVYVPRLSDLDAEVLRELIARGWETNHSPAAD